MARGGLDQGQLGRLVALVAACTLVLTASFVGLVALVGGATTGAGDRLPFYVLVMAVAFVAAVFLAEGRNADGRATIATAGGVALATFVVVALAGEGVVYAATSPGEVLASEFIVYFLAAGLIGTGLGYWGVRHWREFADRPGQRGGL